MFKLKGKGSVTPGSTFHASSSDLLAVTSISKRLKRSL